MKQKIPFYNQFVILAAMITLLPLRTFAYDFMVDNIAYNIVSSTELTCETAPGSNIIDRTVNIPATVTYNGRELKVIGIGKRSFKSKDIYNLTIAKGITYIEESAFEYNCISKIVIPNTVTEIGPGAFCYANYRYAPEGNYNDEVELIFEDGKSTLHYSGNEYFVQQMIEDQSFENTKLTQLYIGRYIWPFIIGRSLTYVYDLEIGDQVTYLPESSFTKLPDIQGSFTFLEELTIGKGLERVPNFKEGSHLSKVYVRSSTPQPSGGFEQSTYVNATLYVPRGTKSLYQNASVWKNFWNIEEYDVKSNDVMVTDITLDETSTKLIQGMTKQLTATISPSNATDQSVSWSSSNTNVVTVSSSGVVKGIGDGTATITCTANDGSGKQATCEVTVLASGSILTAKTIEGVDMKFQITEIYVSSNVLKSANCQVYSESATASAIDVNTVGSITIPNEVEGFKVTGIGYFSFQSCEDISMVTIPETVKTIGGWAFFGCKSLESVVMADGVEVIDNGAFQYVNNLQSITFGRGMKKAGDEILSWCSKLKTIYVMTDDPFDVTETTFDYNNSEDTKNKYYNEVILYVPIGSRPNYVNAEGWKKFKNIVEFDPNDIKEVNIVIDKNVRLYDLSGRQLKKLHKGLNIIDGKKVLVR